MRIEVGRFTQLSLTSAVRGQVHSGQTLVLAALTGWGASASGPHCASHSVQPQAAVPHGDSHSEAAATTWTNAAQHECPHCPPTECSSMAPCAAPASAALSASEMAVADLGAHRVPLPARDEPQPFPPNQPLTPPPQAIS